MASRVSVILRLVDANGQEEHAMNLEHPRSKLDVPLVDLIERFVRHYNRRHETPVVASLLGVSDASGELDPRVAVGNLWDPVVAATLELQLRRQQPRPPPPVATARAVGPACGRWWRTCQATRAWR